MYDQVFVKYAYLGGRDKLKMTIWYEVHTGMLKSISGTNIDFVFVVWPISVGLEGYLMFYCQFRGKSAVVIYWVIWQFICKPKENNSVFHVKWAHVYEIVWIQVSRYSWILIGKSVYKDDDNLGHLTRLSIFEVSLASSRFYVVNPFRV